MVIIDSIFNIYKVIVALTLKIGKFGGLYASVAYMNILGHAFSLFQDIHIFQLDLLIDNWRHSDIPSEEEIKLALLWGREQGFIIVTINKHYRFTRLFSDLQ